MSFAYLDRHRVSSERTARPLGVFFWGEKWSLAAWCELRGDFRNFRLDRMTALALSEERFEIEASRSLAAFFEVVKSEVSKKHDPDAARARGRSRA